eukprot:gb/GFBE01034125.1/.p1 GENE.gb/GFBE01034125.1/~~gb/GFBE01034125.1/.p1  ORF type:complete len:119 (+),score=25.35 gb/GFBE01034125.1/:1-357(+)
MWKRGAEAEHLCAKRLRLAGPDTGFVGSAVVAASPRSVVQWKRRALEACSLNSSAAAESSAPSEDPAAKRLRLHQADVSGGMLGAYERINGQLHRLHDERLARREAQLLGSVQEGRCG